MNKTSPYRPVAATLLQTLADLIPRFRDSEEALARVRLAQQIAAVIERKDLSQTEAAA
jgi:hypothetical protein